MNPQMSLDDYKLLFSHNVRALLNWDLLRETNASVQTKVIASHEELESLFTVWHVDSQGNFADWNDERAKPQTIGEAIANDSQWDAERNRRVASFQEHFASSNEPVTLLLPVYRAGANLVLLDSTHRTVAVSQKKMDFSALAVVLDGIVDERVLPDLRWHARNGSLLP